jgi:hypothetical protein
LLDESAFSNCPSLTSIFIPSAVGTLSGLYFSGCTALSSLTFEVGQLVGSTPPQSTDVDESRIEPTPPALPLGPVHTSPDL